MPVHEWDEKTTTKSVFWEEGRTIETEKSYQILWRIPQSWAPLATLKNVCWRPNKIIRESAARIALARTNDGEKPAKRGPDTGTCSFLRLCYLSICSFTQKMPLLCRLIPVFTQISHFSFTSFFYTWSRALKTKLHRRLSINIAPGCATQAALP